MPPELFSPEFFPAFILPLYFGAVPSGKSKYIWEDQSQSLWLHRIFKSKDKINKLKYPSPAILSARNVKGSSLDRKLDQHKRIKHARNGKYMGKYKWLLKYIS